MTTSQPTGRAAHRSLRVAALAVTLALILMATTACGGGGGSGSKVVARAALNVEPYVARANNAKEFQLIWGAKRSVRQEDAISRLMNDARGLGMTTLRPTQTSAASDVFLSRHQKSSSDLITLVGHNSEGTFKFPDGSPVDLRALGGPGKPLIALISCDPDQFANGAAVGVPTPITIEVALLAEQKFVARVNSLNAAPDVAKTQQLPMESLVEVANERKVNLPPAQSWVWGPLARRCSSTRNSPADTDHGARLERATSYSRALKRM